MFDNFTDSLKEIIYKAQNLAIENHNTMIESAHILYSIIESSSDSAQALLNELKLNTNIFQSDVKNVLSPDVKMNEFFPEKYHIIISPKPTQ